MSCGNARRKAREGETVKVTIKSFDVDMEVKNNGMELDIYEPDGTTFLGDVIVTKTGLIWCKGKTSRAKGMKVTWKEFIERMES
jgi:hypothetical protein